MKNPAITEKERRKPVSLIPYCNQHLTFRCERCKTFKNRKLRVRDGKMNVCMDCKARHA